MGAGPGAPEISLPVIIETYVHEQAHCDLPLLYQTYKQWEQVREHQRYLYL